MFKPKLCIFSIHNSAPKIDRSMQFMSDFSFRHLVYHVSPDWWCCCPFTSRSSRRIDFTEKETLYSKTSWDPVEISLLQVRETYKSSVKKSSQNLFVTQEKFCIIIWLSTWGLQKSRQFFFPVHFFLYHNGLICCQCWFRHEWEKKRRGKLLFFRVSILTSCLFNFHQVLQTLWQFLQLKTLPFHFCLHCLRQFLFTFK